MAAACALLVFSQGSGAVLSQLMHPACAQHFSSPQKVQQQAHLQLQSLPGGPGAPGAPGAAGAPARGCAGAMSTAPALAHVCVSLALSVHFIVAAASHTMHNTRRATLHCTALISFRFRRKRREIISPANYCCLCAIGVLTRKVRLS